MGPEVGFKEAHAYKIDSEAIWDSFDTDFEANLESLSSSLRAPVKER